MSKSPNTDSKRHRMARNCWNCDNGDWLGIRNPRCDCHERSRAASKDRWKKEAQNDLLDALHDSN